MNIKEILLIRNARRKGKGGLLLICCWGLSGCSGFDSTIENPVEWWAVNGWGGTVTIELYDNNCSRNLRDINFKGNQEVKVVSCGDGQGNANVRYRREGYQARTPSWSDDAVLTQNQRAIVR